MLRFMISITLLLIQTGLIGFSGHLLMTGGTEVPGLHISLIFINAAFGLLNVYNLVRVWHQ